MSIPVPECGVDLFGDEYLSDPYPVQRSMRELGPVVRLTRHDALAVTHYAPARVVLGDHETFVSGRGVGFNDEVNAIRSSSVIGSDPPRHEVLRSVLGERLSLRALRGVEVDIRKQAVDLVADVVSRGEFDAVADFAEVLPVSVVGGLIGIPKDSRGPLLRWANGAFNAFGAMGERAAEGISAISEQFAFVRDVAAREQLAPGSMGAAVYEAADRGQIPEEWCLPLMSAYLTAGMDTTVNAISALVMLLGRHPDQWRDVRNRAVGTSTMSVVNEVLRLESPVQAFARVTAAPVELAGHLIEADRRVAILYGCANRDDRQYPDADVFDVRRNPAGHLGFGSGIHSCAGQGLALIELRAVLDALIDQVDEITVGEPRIRLNNVIRGLSALPCRFTAAVTG